jgi:5-methylcytosine-specific restriction endonuclease McrA/predicted nucleic acid-binding Zn ribbon protein
MVGFMPAKNCLICGVEFKAPMRKQKFCSYACAGFNRSRTQRGENHPCWRGGKDKRTCRACGAPFEATPANPQKFCSKPCADKSGYRRSGPDHPHYKPDSRRRNRRGKHGAWARAVISRDGGKCRKCGATEGLHAHHIKPFAEFPELRWELDNGLTVCGPCHWAIHNPASNANGVKSGEVLPGGAGDNPEPSFGRKPVEGVTTNGRAYRRWSGECGWCKAFISKRWSDVKGKQELFCSRSCASKWRASKGIAFRGYRSPRQ